MTELEMPRRLSICLGGEAARVGFGLGYELKSIRGMPAEKWIAASEGDSAALEKFKV